MIVELMHAEKIIDPVFADSSSIFSTVMAMVERFQMRDFLRRTLSHPTLALGSTLLWGVIELVALQNARRAVRASRNH